MYTVHQQTVNNMYWVSCVVIACVSSQHTQHETDVPLITTGRELYEAALKEAITQAKVSFGADNMRQLAEDIFYKVSEASVAAGLDASDLETVDIAKSVQGIKFPEYQYDIRPSVSALVMHQCLQNLQLYSRNIHQLIKSSRSTVNVINEQVKSFIFLTNNVF